ncbi:MAG: matrixin family metalloprotease [Myxococcales bacterium]|jgi:MYXO-CTERM domain-containing protein
MSARKAVAALLAAAAMLPAAALAEEELCWLGARLANGPGQPWIWRLDARKEQPAGIPLAEVERVFKTAFQQWQDVPCAFLSFELGGRDTTHGTRQHDTANVLGNFIEARLEDEELYDLALGSGFAAAAAMPVYYGGTIYECDIVFNAVDFHWATDGNVVSFDLATVVNHETGHCFGLDHYGEDANSVMNPFVNPGDLRRGLTAHDIDNFCRLYPQTGALGSPCPDRLCAEGLTCAGSGSTAYCTKGCDPDEVGACPIGFSCLASSVVPGSPGSCAFGGGASTKVGAPCESGADCGTAADALCIPYDSLFDKWEAGYCTAECSETLPCPASSTCFELPDGERRCVKDCRPGSGDCRFGYACEPMAGGRGRCLPACRSDAECPGGVCNSCSGLCVHAGKPGAKVGDSCSADADCPAGGVCRSDIGGGTCVISCETRCTACPQGSTCLPYAATGERLCFQSCASPSDCPSGLGCWQMGESGGCMPPCESSDECPIGQRCVSGSCLRGPQPDAGCALCDDRDGGLPPLPAADASSAEPSLPPSGCGCSSTPGALLAGLFGLLLAPLRRRATVRRPGRR